MKIRTLVKNQKGLTLIEMLIAILIFILAAVFIVSLVTNALDKPKEAGIMSDFNHYEKTGELLLRTVKETADATFIETEFSSGVDKQATFTGGESKKENAYNNNYKLKVEKDATQTAIIVDTTGKSKNKKYRVVIVKEGKTVESCTFGFGRNDKELKALKNKHCNEAADDGETAYVPVTVVPDGCIEIKTATDLENVKNDMAGCYYVMNDIDLASIPSWTPLLGNSGEFFTGTFDGQRYAISNLTMVNPTMGYQSLFEQARPNAVFKNVALENVNISGAAYAAGLIAQADGIIIEDSYVTGSITGAEGYVAGLAGQATNTTIKDSYSTATLSSGDDYVGGLAGYSTDLTIVDSYATGSVTGYDYTGGLVGMTQASSITGSNSSSTVLGADYTGGLVGFVGYAADTTTIADSNATGAVTGLDYTGGLAGFTDNTNISDSYATGASIGTANTGGLVGDATNSDVTNSYASGEVTGTGTIGGLLGASTDGDIVGSYATGDVHGISLTGGLVGRLTSTSTINTSYATGNVDGSATIGGLVGLHVGQEIANSYATGNVSASDYEVGGLVGAAIYPVKTSYSTGAVSGTVTDAGGLLGVYVPGDATESYYDSTKSLQSDTGKGAPKTTTEMQQQATFAGWDFTTVWKITEGSTYPTLR